MRAPNRPDGSYFNRASPQANGLVAAWPMFTEGRYPINVAETGGNMQMEGSSSFPTWNVGNANGQAGAYASYFYTPALNGFFADGGWNPLLGASAMTMMAWVRPVTSSIDSNWARVMSLNQTGGGDDEWCLGINSTALPFARMNTSGGWREITGSSADFDKMRDQWIHFAATWTADPGATPNLFQMFGNGELFSSTGSQSGTLEASTNSFAIGTRYGDGRRFEGFIMDVRLYNVDHWASIDHFVNPATRWDLYTQPPFQLFVPEAIAAAIEKLPSQTQIVPRQIPIGIFDI